MKTHGLVGILLVFAVSAGLAQGPGVKSGAQDDRFTKRDNYTFQLMRMIRNIEEIDKDPKYALTPAQAKQVLSTLKPLRAMPELTQDKARETLASLKKALTVDQLNAISRVKPLPRHGKTPPDMKRPAPEKKPAEGERPAMDRNQMKNFNPFYADPKSGKKVPGADRTKHMDEFFSKLEKRAKQKQDAKQVKPAPKTKAKSSKQ